MMARHEYPQGPSEWLTRGCGPLGHTLIALSLEDQEAALRCTRCDRREAVDGSTCLVCNDSGSQRVQLYREQSMEPVTTGLLCPECAAGLLVPGGVAGWWAVSLDTASGVPNGFEGLQAGD